MAPYQPHRYWQDRLSRQFDLAGVGLVSKGRNFNRIAYRLRADTLARALARLKIDPGGRRVLDVGSGTGFYIDFWQRRGADVVWGLDLTEKSVSELTRRFPASRFFVQDIGAPLRHELGTFDIVGIFDVLFHITDDRSFEQALANLASLLAPGGVLILTDILGRQDALTRRHVRVRSREHYRSSLAAQGIDGLVLRPQFFTLNAPLALGPRLVRNALTLLWEAATLPARCEPVGAVIGSVGYLIDRICSQTLATGPSTKLLFGWKRASERTS